ncbi:MAG TPA: hypothetical protein VNW97_23970 [Candidatus Saccharimonadales bacterium]|jgi:hypothetical protein|nr:hypothetical protein [Candidatus Saccharimonadales bacterium]
MKHFRFILPMVLLAGLAVGAAAQQRVKLGENAALRYWSAFAQMQDSDITDQQAKELNLILEGAAPYSDLKYRGLVQKNQPAIDTMVRGTALPNCDWGLDYQLGPETPIDFVRKGLALGRLNVLYALHLLQTGGPDGAAHVLAAGLRFSHDVANGGTLFATLVAKHLLADHLRVIAFALHSGALSKTQRSFLRDAMEQLGTDGLDWKANLKRELEIPSGTARNGLDAQALAALVRITPVYVASLDKPSTLPELQQLIASAPRSLQEILPNPRRAIEEKKDLRDKLAQIRGLLQ